MDPSARLLLVAPSNSAADLLAEKALERGVSVVVLGSMGRSVEEKCGRLVIVCDTHMCSPAGNACMHLYHTMRHVCCPFVKPTLCVSHFQVPESQIMRVCAFSRPKGDLPCLNLGCQLSRMPFSHFVRHTFRCQIARSSVCVRLQPPQGGPARLTVKCPLPRPVHTLRPCPHFPPPHFQVPEGQIMRVCAFSRPDDDLTHT